MTKKMLMFTVLIVLVIGLFIWNINFRARENKLRLENLIPDAKAEVVASVTCGCCKAYSQYLSQLGFEVDLKQTTQDEVTAYKNANLIPASLRSCHTSRIGDYIVEGHIPIEAIEKLFKEKPDIKGIGMAGMPLGSPGMPGAKQPFEIYVITNDGQEGDLFMEL